MKKTVLVKSLSLFLSFVLMLSTFASFSVFADELNGWNEDHTIYYENSVAVTGFKTINGYDYYFSPETTMAVTGLKKIDNAYYYFSEKGIMQHNWRTISGERYYFSPENGQATTGLTKIDGATYFFGTSGKRKEGLKTINSKKYYFSKNNGKAVKGLKVIDGNRYYFGKNYKAVKGWKTVGKKRYYFDKKSYKAYKGLKKIGSYRYYFNIKSEMVTGWKTVKAEKYYFSPKKKTLGRAATGTVKINGKTYKFNKKGQLISAKQMMKRKANKISSPTKYLILVNKSTHKVGVFKGKKGDWKLINYWTCTIGAPATPTPSGTFLMGPSGGKPFHQVYFDSAQIRCWYASRITGGYNFHSVLYSQASKPVRVVNPRLGANLSHGCIRLKIENAKWIYNKIPKNTKCVIYK
ncbi:MAG: L,D-transpeptidase family protein [Eubacterium sp.]|nr:L,D-transpeptidase family protein [Eubacterium sp.]